MAEIWLEIVVKRQFVGLFFFWTYFICGRILMKQTLHWCLATVVKTNYLFKENMQFHIGRGITFPRIETLQPIWQLCVDLVHSLLTSSWPEKFCYTARNVALVIKSCTTIDSALTHPRQGVYREETWWAHQIPISAKNRPFSLEKKIQLWIMSYFWTWFLQLFMGKKNLKFLLTTIFF